MGDGEEEPDDAQWSLDAIRSGYYTSLDPPSERRLGELMIELRNWWGGSENMGAMEVLPFIAEKLRLPQTFRYDHFDTAFSIENMVLNVLNSYARKRDMPKNDEPMAGLRQASWTVFQIKNVLTQLGIMKRCINWNGPPDLLPNMKEFSSEELIRELRNNPVDFDDKDLNDAHKLCIALEDRIASQGLRRNRRTSMLYSRVTCPSGYDSMAFEMNVSIPDFVAKECSARKDHVLFKQGWLANNIQKVKSYLSESDLIVDDIKENHHLRSFAGGPDGRGAGVYDCRADMFFPYVCMGWWPEMAKNVEEIRRRFDPAYACSAPNPAHVCVVHLESSFPYDIYGEVIRIGRTKPECTWRAADHFECRNMTEVCIDAKHARVLVTPNSGMGDVIGMTWQLVPPGEYNSFEELPEDTPLHRHLQDKDGSLIMIHPPEIVPAGLVWDTVAKVGEYCYAPLLHHAQGPRTVLPADFTLASISTPSLKRVFVRIVQWIPGSPGEDAVELRDDDLLEQLSDQWHRASTSATTPGAVPQPIVTQRLTNGMVIGGNQYVTCNGVHHIPKVLHFRIDTGRTWSECESPAVERIYDSQKFTRHDKFTLYACKGRLCFKIHECDRGEFTLTVEGIGGSGKSTLLKTMDLLYAEHLAGHLSANMQDQFGLSNLANSMVVFCNEFGPEINLRQEEWQACNSGEKVTLAVKHVQKTVDLTWMAHFFFVGNGYPSHWNNMMGQVSRRMMGVYAEHMVTPRDGAIMDQIKSQIGQFLRKIILAYFSFVDVHGTIDPLSEPQYLAPAFKEYYERGVKLTNPMKVFIDEGKYVTPNKDPTNTAPVTMSTFQKCYDHWLERNRVKRYVRWDLSVYSAAIAMVGRVTKKDIENYRERALNSDEVQIHPGMQTVFCGLDLVDWPSVAT